MGCRDGALSRRCTDSEHDVASHASCSRSASPVSSSRLPATYSTEFALRPVAAQALEAGPPPRRLTAGIMGRLMIVWFLGSLPVVGIALLAVFALSLRNLTETQFAVAYGFWRSSPCSSASS